MASSCTIFSDGDLSARVDALVAALKKDGYSFGASNASPDSLDAPIGEARRLVCVGMGVGGREYLASAKGLARAIGAAFGSTRPVAKKLQIVEKDRFVGLTGQKFHGDLCVTCGASGSAQHLAGIKGAKTVVAINRDASAPIFKAATYGIVGDMHDVLPLLTAALENA